MISDFQTRHPIQALWTGCKSEVAIDDNNLNNLGKESTLVLNYFQINLVAFDKQISFISIAMATRILLEIEISEQLWMWSSQEFQRFGKILPSGLGAVIKSCWWQMDIQGQPKITNAHPKQVCSLFHQNLLCILSSLLMNRAHRLEFGTYCFNEGDQRILRWAACACFNSFHASRDFYHVLINFANNLDLGPNGLTLYIKSRQHFKDE